MLYSSYDYWGARVLAAKKLGARVLFLHHLIYGDGFDWKERRKQGLFDFQISWAQLSRATRSDASSGGNMLLLLLASYLTKTTVNAGARTVDDREANEQALRDFIGEGEASVFDMIASLFSEESGKLKKGVLIEVEGELFFVVGLWFLFLGDSPGIYHAYLFLLYCVSVILYITERLYCTLLLLRYPT